MVHDSYQGQAATMANRIQNLVFELLVKMMEHDGCWFFRRFSVGSGETRLELRHWWKLLRSVSPPC